MTDAELMSRFFSAWGMDNAQERLKVLETCLGENAVYADAHCPAPISGPSDINGMLASFTENMPGASAQIVSEPGGHNGYLRATVSFQNNGAEMMRGQYFAHRDGDHLTQVIGFVGMGDT